MKKIIKKLLATAMAFTLVGLCNTFTDTIKPDSQKIQSVHAVQCMHVTKRHESAWEYTDYKVYYVRITIDYFGHYMNAPVKVPTARTRTVTDYCEKCGMTFNCSVIKEPV